jgi:ferritin-like metal-binding protein YciE
MASQSSLNDLFYYTLRDIYHGEKQLLKALPKMAKKANSPELRLAFENHYEETQGQVERLERVFEMINKRTRGRTCEAIEGLIAEGEEVMDEAQNAEVMDAGLIAAGQAVEHYEIARYGTLRAWAEQLGMPEVADLMEQTLKEEKNADDLLNKLAMGKINRKAA